ELDLRLVPVRLRRQRRRLRFPLEVRAEEDARRDREAEAQGDRVLHPLGLDPQPDSATARQRFITAPAVEAKSPRGEGGDPARVPVLSCRPVARETWRGSLSCRTARRGTCPSCSGSSSNCIRGTDCPRAPTLPRSFPCSSSSCPTTR